MRHEVFQRFFAENFECVRKYLNRGISDHREYFWQEFKDFIEKSDKSTIPLNYIGEIYLRYDNKGKEGYLDSNNNTKSPKVGLVSGKDRTNLENLTIKVRNDNGEFTDLQLTHISSHTKNNHETYEKFSFESPGVDGKGFVIVGPVVVNDKNNISYRRVYCSDIFTDFKVSDESVFDAFFGFFSAVLHASKQDETNAAYFNLEQSLKLIIGEPVNPLRYLVAFTDQYTKYLLDFYGLSKNVTKKGESKNITLDDRISWLARNVKGCKSLIQTLYLRKSLRNKASHEDKRIENYRENVQHFILDFICITYLIQHNVQDPTTGRNPIPIWNASDRLEAIKAFFTHVANHNIKIDIANDGFSENGACFIKPLKIYTVSSVESSGNTVSNEIEIGKDLLEYTNLELTLFNNKIIIDSNTRLEEINSFDYGPLVNGLITSDRELAKAIDRLTDKVDSLPFTVKDIEKLKESLEATIAQFSERESNEVKNALNEIKKSMDEDMPRLKADIDKLNKRIDWIAKSGVVVLLLGLIIVVLSNMEGIAIRSDFF